MKRIVIYVDFDDPVSMEGVREAEADCIRGIDKMGWCVTDSFIEDGDGNIIEEE